MAVVAMLGVFLTTRSVQYLSEELQPAASANQDILTDLGDLRSATREWVVGGRQSARADYEEAQELLTAHLQTVADLTGDDRRAGAAPGPAGAGRPDLGRRLRQRRSSPGPADPGTSTGGCSRPAWPSSTTSGRPTTTPRRPIESRVQRRPTRHSSQRLTATVLAVLVLALLEALVIVRARRRLTAEIAEPLHEPRGRGAARIAAEGSATLAPLLHQSHVEVHAVGQTSTTWPTPSPGESVEEQDPGGVAEPRRRPEQLRLEHLSRAPDPLTTISGYLELVADERGDGRAAPA